MAHRLSYRFAAGGRIFKPLQQNIDSGEPACESFFCKKAYEDQDHSKKLRTQKVTRDGIHPRVGREGFPH